MQKTTRLQVFLRKLKTCSRGFAVAEFAVVLPAVICLVSIFIWILSLCITQIQLVTAAGQIARTVSRGGDAVAIEKSLPIGTTVSVLKDTEVINVLVSNKRKFPFRIFTWSIKLHANSHALVETYAGSKYESKS